MGTKFKGTKEEILDLNCFIKFFRASEVLKNNATKLINEQGYSDGQFFVLDVLYHLGELPQKIISEKIMRTEGNLTMIINNLLKRKLIKRIRSKDDKRIFLISISEKGKLQYEMLFPFFLEAVKKNFSVLSVEEKILLEGICKKLGDIKK
jgi:MarR family 2-MHQ and catechol resistance regulon transcriptional repressor